VLCKFIQETTRQISAESHEFCGRFCKKHLGLFQDTMYKSTKPKDYYRSG